LRSEQADGAVCGHVIIVKASSDCSSPMKALRVGEVGRISILRDDATRCRAENAHRFRIVFVELECSGKLRIELAR